MYGSLPVSQLKVIYEMMASVRVISVRVITVRVITVRVVSVRVVTVITCSISKDY